MKKIIIILILLVMLCSLVWADLGDELIQAGDLAEVERLLEAGADVNSQNNDGRTTLLLASDWGHSKIVELLLSAGADVNLQNDWDWTALMYASDRDHTEIVELLKNVGAVE